MLSSIILLFMFTAVFVVIIEIFTVLFRLTGLSEEKAKFQVISLLTACGFTTSQSEAITISKKRRRLASITMMFGYTFSLVIVALVINLFFQLTNSELNTFLGFGLTAAGVALLIFILTKSRRMKIHFDAFINRIYTKLRKKKGNNVMIMEVFSHKIMANVHLASLPQFLKDMPLKDSGLKQKYKIQVLFITRNGTIMEHIDGDTILQEDDDIIVFGKEKEIMNLFNHTSSIEGQSTPSGDMVR